ncbi:MAG: serine acetyltransferase [Cyclobacteriaceae bacterium]|nr:serine acetyltransferase [Cyclobacteriaceae bacterium]
MEQEFLNKLFKTHQDCPGCPSPKVVVSFFDDILGTLFPDFTKQQFNDQEQFNHHFHLLKARLKEILARNPLKGIMNTDIAAEEFFRILPNIYEKLKEDIEAMFEGDPAAKSKTEVIRTYPGFYAIASYRIAHALYKLDIQLIPRILTENAHSRTGIDIHPAAAIGHHFCIDHGTGVVIGETTNIGNYVKIYQGVTLGALSVNKEDAAIKRHPSIGDHVVIYAGATILGGKTHIGNYSVIGGNVWLTRSVPDYSKIYYQANMMNSQTGETDLIIFKEHEE